LAKSITKRDTDYSKWYTDICLRAELADYAPVKGCMVIRPNGYAIWENMRAALDAMFRETGHKNCYFPMFIPESFMKKEAEHVEGFAPECAVVTEAGGKPLEEKLYIRPTSETIVWHMYKNWIESYRDLPLLYNQWANICRWEKRTRLFLRTSEFLWQEGHTAHATEQEALEETLQMLDIYRRFAEEWMAMPVVCGRKTENEKFAGAVDTYSIEGMMQDKKALQAGTSHFLGQNFAKAFDVQFQNEQGQLEYAWATSWGVSTRLIGGLIMTHSDDNGLVVPPKLAPTQVVVVPIWRDDVQRTAVLEAADKIKTALPGLLVDIDARDNVSPGWKFNEHEVKGVPVRIEIGPRDVEQSSVVVARRDTCEKSPMPMAEVEAGIPKLIDDIQAALFSRAKATLDDNSYPVDSYDELKQKAEEPGGFLYCHWCGGGECEKQAAEETKATIRNIPLDAPKEDGACVLCGKPSKRRVLFAKAY
jgi:prolyl-tRNA synthetase